MSKKPSAISDRLSAWYRRGHRDLPWRRTSDPYRIWVSEIMLQQTRVEAVIPYYERFLERFPTVQALAVAEEDEVLALWSGLGYYSRARNLLHAARAIAAGGLPRNHEGLRALAGVGDYTAAAIASIAFGLPHAAVDGNVLRVVARVENDASDIGTSGPRRRFGEIAQSWLDVRHPGLFNQAMMELGATVCLPKDPRCGVCPLAAACRAHREGTAAQLPVKLRKTAPVAIEAVLLVVRNRGRVLLRRREDSARRMPGFWDLPAPADIPGARAGKSHGTFRHTITHYHYTFTVLAGTAPRGLLPAGCRWCSSAQFQEIPLSTTACKALKLAGVL